MELAVSQSIFPKARRRTRPTRQGTEWLAALHYYSEVLLRRPLRIPNPVVPTEDGLSLVSYTASDAGQLTVNGELNKLGHNVSFGHGTTPASTGAPTRTFH